MNLKRRYFLLPGLLLLTLMGYSQQKELPQSISMEEAVQLALKYNLHLEQKNLETRVSLKKVEEIKWQKIPDIYANFDLRYNAVAPTTPVPAKAFYPNAADDEIMPLKFMTKWRNTAGINVEYDIFNPNNYGKIREAEQEVEISKTDEKITRLNLTYLTRQDYTACLIAHEQLVLAIADTLSKDRIHNMMRDRYEAGRIVLSELNNIRVEKNNALSTWLEVQKIYDNSLTQLLNDMGFEPHEAEAVHLSENLSGLLAAFQQTKPGDTQSQTLQKLAQQRELSEIQLKNTKLGFLPTVSLNGFWGTNYFNNRFDIFYSPFWYGNSYLGLSVNLPITRGIDRVKKAEVLELQIKQSRIDYEIKQLDQAQNFARLQKELTFRQQNLSLKEKNKELSRANLLQDTELLENGRLLTGDWSRSNMQYLRASTEYLQAVYDYLIVGMELEKAILE